MKETSSQLAAMLQMKCPQCREGHLFMYPQAHFHLKKFNKMHKNCPVCGLHYEREPGFFFGAMYISYALNVALMITLFVAISILRKPKEVWEYLVVIIPSFFLFFPLNFRLSRSLMLHLFGGVKYAEHKKH
ncbi:MAG: DUF983 domain-containing protein [Flammeovirgaceae bacterium]|nr:DUF983 domain-containing protein [Flammeovirgaceae bacterium]MDW8286841.1 DUF983 domain-containing protein [Flammeovirgaceae bacterium]